MSPVSNRLRQAILDGDVATVAELAPTDPHLDEVVATNMTPLMLAIEMEQYAAAAALLDGGADVNQPTATGWTALHHAVDAAQRLGG